MAFNIQTLSRISGSANNTISELKNGTIVGAPNFFSYVSITDTLADLESAGYFNPQAREMNVGDTLYCVASDGIAFFVVNSIDLSPDVVVVSTFTVVTGVVSGPVTSTDDALPRWSGVTGTQIKDSLAILDDAGALSGLTRLTTDAIDINANAITTTGLNADLNLSGSGTGIVIVDELKDFGIAAFQGVVTGTNSLLQAAVASDQTDFVLTSTGAATPPEFKAIPEIIVPTQVIIQQLADLPTPVAGVIPLASNTSYYFQGSVNIGANTLDFAGPNTSITGVEKRITFIITNNATSLITTTGQGNESIYNISLQQDGAGSLAIIDNGGNGTRFDVANCNFYGGGVIGKAATILQVENCLFEDCGYVHDVPGIRTVSFVDTVFSDTAGATTFFKFEAVATAASFFIINGILATTNGATAFDAFDPNLIDRGTVTETVFAVGGVLFVGMSQASNTWRFLDNTDIPTSNDSGTSLLTAASALITPVVADTYIDIAGAGINWTLGAGTEKFTLNNAANGELMYNGGRGGVFGFGGSITALRSGAGDFARQFTVFVNGIATVAGTSIVWFTTIEEFTVVIPYFTIVLTSGDTIKIQFKNVTSTEGIQVNNAALSIGR